LPQVIVVVRAMLLIVGFTLFVAWGCGARTELDGAAVAGDAGVVPLPTACEGQAVEPCGSDVGACSRGTRACVDGFFGPCTGGLEPTQEACNDVDDDCDGTTDEDFGVGQACDGPDNDLCTDDVVSCAGCSQGPDTLETCNGADDDCDGIVDADCESGNCGPTLLVTGSVPSSSGCVDFPVMAGSIGLIQYPCAGGQVTAELGTVPFTGSVEGGFVSLSGTAIIPADLSPDGCVWQTNHQISGTVSSGELSYSYSEMWVEGVNCWYPCTETGTVQIQWIQ
jgi:hypothetical protein